METAKGSTGTHCYIAYGSSTHCGPYLSCPDPFQVVFVLGGWFRHTRWQSQSRRQLLVAQSHTHKALNILPLLVWQLAEVHRRYYGNIYEQRPLVPSVVVSLLCAFYGGAFLGCFRECFFGGNVISWFLFEFVYLLYEYSTSLNW